MSNDDKLDELQKRFEHFDPRMDNMDDLVAELTRELQNRLVQFQDQTRRIDMLERVTYTDEKEAAHFLALHNIDLSKVVSTANYQRRMVRQDDGSYVDEHRISIMLDTDFTDHDERPIVVGNYPLTVCIEGDML